MDREQAIAVVQDLLPGKRRGPNATPVRSVAEQIVDALGIGQADPELPAPTEDQLRLAQAALGPLTDVQRRAVYAVVAYVKVRELEGERDG